MGNNKKKSKKTTPAPFATYGNAGGTPLNTEAGTTRPPESNTDEMRRWSKENQQ